MNLFAILRLVVYAKRISASLESCADSLASLARIKEAEWEKENAPRVAVKTSIGTFDRAKASFEYERTQAERGMLDR